jgi:hypothetical protein
MTGSVDNPTSGFPAARLAALAAACLLGCGSAITPPSTCATMATPDLSVQGGFDVDTGLPSSSTVGASYGQPLCPDQFLVEADLTAPAFEGFSMMAASGFWSNTLPAQPCDMEATMSTFVLNGARWYSWDVVRYAAQSSGAYCFPQAQSHTNPNAVGIDVAHIPLTSGFSRARIAVNAVEAGSNTPVAVVGQLF